MLRLHPKRVWVRLCWAGEDVQDFVDLCSGGSVQYPWESNWLINCHAWCSFQKAIGKCFAIWMRDTSKYPEGFCAITCGMCPCENPQLRPGSPSGPNSTSSPAVRETHDTKGAHENPRDQGQYQHNVEPISILKTLLPMWRLPLELFLIRLPQTGTSLESPPQSSPSGSGEEECECSDFIPPGISYSCGEQVMIMY